MSGEQDLEPTMSAEEREALTLLSERLERERPVPAAGFRGGLRRHLLAAAPHRSNLAAGRYRLLAVSYAGVGAICLAVAAVGLTGVGPFAA